MFQKYSQNIKIGKRILSDNSKVYVIAEIGINHEGSISRCKKLIKLAKQSNADAVKIQLSNPELNYSKKIKSFKLYKKSLLTPDQISKIYKFAKKLNLEIFATIDQSYLDLVKKLKQRIFKISSSLNRDIFFIEKISKLNFPILISTGMSSLKEIKQISDYLKKKTKNNKIIFMHAVSLYPPNLRSINLGRIHEIKKKIKCLVGYSDHYPGPYASIMSIMYGAKIIEKHFTDDVNRKGYDHNISSTAKELKYIIKQIRIFEKFLILKNDSKIFENQRIISQKRDYTLNKYIKKNERITKEDINTIRTGKDKKNLSISELLNIMNKRSKKNLKKSSILKISDFK